MILESPIDPRVQAAVDRTHGALRASLRPIEHRTAELTGGHYRTAVTTGLTTTLAAGVIVASMRWTSSEFRLALQRLTAYANLTTAFGTAQEISLDLVKVINFTASDSSGTAITMGTTGQKGPGMAPSRLADFRVATATAVAAGTGTEEANPIGKIVFPLANTLGLAAQATLFDAAGGHEHPIILDPMQGLRTRIGVTQGATGVVRYTFVYDWVEVPVANY